MKRQTKQFCGMGCQMQVWLEADDDVLADVVAIFAEAERRFSRFLLDSELCQLNMRQGEWVAVSDPMWQMIQRAFDLAHVTTGLFDPTILSALEKVGYADSFDALASIEVCNVQTSRCNFQDVQFNEETRSVWLPLGVRIDLGGIVKGATAQSAVNYLSQFGSCLIDAGGDLVAGNVPHDSPLGWPVAISAPWVLETPTELQRLWLVNATLATSGVDYRHWQQRGKHKHHIIDPQTADSADTDLLSVSILANDACEAEAWATAALVAGRDCAQYRLKQEGVWAFLVDNCHAISTIKN